MADEDINNASNAVVAALEPAEVTTKDFAGEQGAPHDYSGATAKYAVQGAAKEVKTEDAGADAAAAPLAIPLAIPAAVVDPSFGIDPSALLAPVSPPPRKKRKAQDEFTISQKLDILRELKGPNAPSVPELAARHGTSRTSIYRWKKDYRRLQRLARTEGKGGRKRATLRRKCHNEEYTAAERLAVVRELQGKDAPSVRRLAERCGANHRSIYRWKKDEARLVRLVEEDGRGNCKRVGGDPLFRIKDALKMFRVKNYVDSETGLPVGVLTGTIVAAKAKQIRDQMLARDQKNPFLSEEELKAMKEFTASGSWGRKIVNKFGWKVDHGDTTSAESAPADDAAAGAPPKAKAVDIDDVAPPSKSPPRPRSTAAQREAGRRAEMRREVTTLKRKLSAAEARVRDLEADNARLRAHVVALTDGGAGGFPGGMTPTAAAWASGPRADELAGDVAEDVFDDADGGRDVVDEKGLRIEV